MKKTKLFGSKIIEDVKVPRIPDVIILDEDEKIHDLNIEEGDLLDANSIRKIISNTPGGMDIGKITNQQIDDLFS